MKMLFDLKVALIISLLLLFLGCNDSSRVNNPDTIQGSGNIITAERNVAECTGIGIINTGMVYLKQDTLQSVRIEADHNIIDNVITHADGGILKVGLADGSYSGITLKFYISLKNISQLYAEGAGSIECVDAVRCGDLACAINGAGKIKLIGEGDNLNCAINGAGNLDAVEFKVTRCNVSVNGAGRCVLYVTDLLEASVNGTGSITYYGNPSAVNSSVAGLGQISEGH